MKKLIDKVLIKALERLLEILLISLEKWLDTDLDGNGVVGDVEKEEVNEE